MSDLILAIVSDHLREGLPALLNKLQKCKGNFQSDEEEIQLQLSTTFINGLDSIVDLPASLNNPSKYVLMREIIKTEMNDKSSKNGMVQLDSLEAYADQLHLMSEMTQIDERIQSRVDDLVFIDTGFLHSSEENNIA